MVGHKRIGGKIGTCAAIYFPTSLRVSAIAAMGWIRKYPPRIPILSKAILISTWADGNQQKTISL